MSDNINQKDLVLSPGEYAYILDETKGNISCLVGPYKTSLSQSDQLVIFDEKTKSFKPCDYEEVRQLFVTIPVGWYCILKNPTKDNKHPVTGTVNMLDNSMEIGVKINISGPDSFALYPGQMAKVIKGHTLKTNEYLVAKVYDANSVVGSKENYYNGQIIIIKGTEYSFFIPQTGIEVIPDSDGNYVRKAVTLTDFEYCVLEDENGTRRYVHGATVVFPKATEKFVETNGQIIQKAIELSEISGVYVKVICDYKDEDDKEYHKGDELFITGKDTMIYYPRVEHSIITYDGKITHHAIAIPEGQGRYILNRLTGEVRTVLGPTMFLPDPRYEVMVRRKLTEKQCKLWYPGNDEVFTYNTGAITNVKTVDAIHTADFCIDNCVSNIPKVVKNFDINRNNEYTPPRAITLDNNKFDGAVVVNVWNGYAVVVINKWGESRVEIGPKTVILNYDETLQEFFAENDVPQVYLPYKYIEIPVEVMTMTSDGVNVTATTYLTFGIESDENKIKSLFSMVNFKQILQNNAETAIVEALNHHTVKEFYTDAPTIIRDALNQVANDDFLFLNIIIDEEELGILNDDIAEKLCDYQSTSICAQLDSEIEEYKKATHLNKLATDRLIKEATYKNDLSDIKEAYDLEMTETKNKQDVALVQTETQGALFDEKHRQEEETNKLSIDKMKNTTDNYANLISSIGPELTAAISTGAQTELLGHVAKAIAPYAIANDESVADVVNKLLRGDIKFEALINSIPNT